VHCRVALALAGVVVVAGCSGGSSAGGSSPAPSATSSHVDRAAIESVLDHVVSGLHAATSISGAGGVSDDAAALNGAAKELDSAGQALNPAPAGVPSTTALTVSTGLLRISGLLGNSARCLTAQAQTKQPSTTPCLPPLRKAEKQDASLARGLISLAAYGTRSPKSFEAKLVAALRGR
jgi:hypothetical protein